MNYYKIKCECSKNCKIVAKVRNYNDNGIPKLLIEGFSNHKYKFTTSQERDKRDNIVKVNEYLGVK